VLSAGVIAVGLVFISRGLGSHLTALRTVEAYETLVSLARGTLVEWEQQRVAGRPLPPERAGTCAEPFEAFHWRVGARLREDLTDAQGIPIAAEVTLSIDRADPPSGQASLTTIWRIDWVPSTWY